MPRVCLKPICDQYIEMHHMRIFFCCLASWLFHITWCSFTICLSSRGKLTLLFVCHELSVWPLFSAEYKIRSGQIRSSFLDALDAIKREVSFHLEDKHVVNEHHALRKSHDATQKMSSRGAFQCTMWLVQNKLVASKTLFWRQPKNLWVSTRKSDYINWQKLLKLTIPSGNLIVTMTEKNYK